VTPLSDVLARNARPAMRALLVAAVLVLLIAGANCCMFLLGHAATRRKEIAVRQAFGATRARVLRQLLTELLALGFTGGVIAFAISGWLLTTMQKLLPVYHVQPSESLEANAHTFVYSLLLCILLSLLAGLVPTLRCSSPASLEVLKDYSGPLAGGGGPLLRRLMVVIEVSVAVVLVIGAILSVRTFLNLIEADPGYRARQVFAVQTAFPRSQFNDQRFLAQQREILNSVRGAPGVSSVAAASALPTAGPNGGEWVRHGNAYKFCLTTLVVGDYFRALKIPLMTGRPFSEADRDAVIISERAAREFWRGKSPVGDELRIDGEAAPRRVIGIVKDTRGISLNETAQPQIYLPYDQPYRGKLSTLSMYVLARCGLGRANCASLLMQRVKSAGSGAAVDRVASLEELVETATAPVRARAALLAFYGLLGAALAWLGVYALVSYLAAVRNYEMGVRMTFGAQASDVVFLLSSEGVICAGVGVLIGVAASYGAVRVLASLLFGVKPLDAASFAVAAFLLFTGAVLACLVPALRVARREPWEILQSR
ncbi:MAG: FtsX-like permease family protein, partial [Terriglobia bacterium]